MEVIGNYTSKELSNDEGLAWEVFLQGLDVTSSELINGARKECENPFTPTPQDPLRNLKAIKSLGTSLACVGP